MPHFLKFYERISRFSRLIKFDRRGTGLSDRVRETPSLETRMDDVRAVLDAVGAHRAALFGTFEAAAMCMLFAASYPERTSGLVLYNPVAKGSWAPDYPWAMTADELRRQLAYLEESWGTPEFVDRQVRDMAPTRTEDAEFKEDILRNLRLGASPSAAQAITRMATEIDIRDVLPTIRVPALILAWPTARDEARFIADEDPGRPRVRRHRTGLHGRLARGRRLRRGRTLRSRPRLRDGARNSARDGAVHRHRRLDRKGRPSSATAAGRSSCPGTTRSVRRHLDTFGGSEIDTAGDGFFASFEGPLRAIRCARAIGESVRSLGVEVRAGLHTGECERVDGKIGGLAVNIGARVAAAAGPGELLVSSTVKDLVAGSARRVRRPRHARAEGRARRVAALRGEERLGRSFEPLAERFEHLALDRRRLVEHAPERAVGDHERARGGDGRHGRRARELRDQRDLPEEVSVGERPKLLLPARHLRGAVRRSRRTRGPGAPSRASSLPSLKSSSSAIFPIASSSGPEQRAKSGTCFKSFCFAFFRSSTARV